MKNSLEKLFADDKFIGNVCGSYRHDYGLLDVEKRAQIRNEVTSFFNDILNNLPEEPATEKTKFLKLIEAWYDGGKIETKNYTSFQINEVTGYLSIIKQLIEQDKLGIRQSPKYKPYQRADESWVGKEVKVKGDSITGEIKSIKYTGEWTVAIDWSVFEITDGYSCYTIKELHEHCTWADGSPCGEEVVE
jgi:hypothetical protein